MYVIYSQWDKTTESEWEAAEPIRPPLRCHSAADNELRASRRVLSFSYFTAQELTETTGTVKPTAVSSAVDTVLFL